MMRDYTFTENLFGLLVLLAFAYAFGVKVLRPWIESGIWQKHRTITATERALERMKQHGQDEG
jgi:hypothetical protein